MNVQAKRNRDKALVLAQFYFDLIANRAGIKWDSDNRAEVEEMVDLIIRAAVEETKVRFKELEDRMDQMNMALEGVYFRNN